MEGDERKEFKKLFPNLIRELETGESKITVDSVENDPNAAQDATCAAEESTELVETEEEFCTESDKFRHYCPDVVDFLRRCDTEAQAEEIISYLQRRNELTAEKACELRAQLKKDGVRSFGPKKEDNYYFKASGFC